MITNFMMENIIFLIVYLTSFICFKHNKQVSIALFTTNTLGLLLPTFNLNDFSSFSFLVGAVIALIGCKDLKGNEINHAIAYLYCLRVIIDLPKIAEIAEAEISWIISVNLLLLQLILAGGAGIGYGKRINNYLARCRSNINNLIFG